MGIDTKGKLLDVAQQMMLARGFAATSVDEICQKAKFTKGCFFHYFESKEELGRALVEKWAQERKTTHDTGSVFLVLLTRLVR